MLKFKYGDIVNGNYPVFCQQVNCKGVMGAGLAKQIRSKYPEVYTEYKQLGSYRLATVQYVQTHDRRICINMFAQDGYGRDKKYTCYAAFKQCLLEIANFAKFSTLGVNQPIAFPYGIGCGLAGGDWNIIFKMIEEFEESIPQDVIIVQKKDV